MSGWRHVERFSNGDCREWLPDISPYREACNCVTPAPDPASPCGQRDHPKGLPCGAVASDGWHRRRMWEQDPELWHAHQPTRCTCGHPIEQVTSK